MCSTQATQQPQLGLLCTTTSGSDASTGVIAGAAGSASADDIAADSGVPEEGVLVEGLAGTGAAAMGADAGSGVRAHAADIARPATAKTYTLERARTRAAIIE